MGLHREKLVMSMFIAIIGNRNSGKSTIIKSLTGCPTGQFRGSITDRATSRIVEIIGSSPQEKALSLTELQKILRRGLKPNCNGVICALQPTNPSKRLSLEDVMQTALAFGYQVRPFVLDPEHGGATGNLSKICNRFPTGVLPAVQLDARRFAHLNASIIHSYTSIVA